MKEQNGQFLIMKLDERKKSNTNRRDTIKLF